MKRGRRPLISDEDRQLWDLVRHTATPLRPEPPPAPAPPTPAPEEPQGRPARATKSLAAVPPPPKPMPAPPPSLGGLDRKTMTRLSRGSIAIDARIDLHGMTQDAAHRRLLRFLEAAQDDGARIVLVITGKGAAEATEGGRGVLRRAVPEWLRSPQFRVLVSGQENAGRRHGGEGALYVRIKRRRPGG